MKHSIFAAALLTLLVSACAPQAVPTIDPAQIQASAVAAASTMIAQTQAAIPPTPIPTDTPQATPTALDTPTAFTLPTSALATAAPTTASGSGNCVHPLDMGEAGPKHDTVIKNQTNGTINLSLNLYTPNAFGQCGAISYASLTKNNSIQVGLPSGNWYAYAWGNANGKQFTVSGSFYVQPAISIKMELCVRPSSVIYAQSC
jgi:hypothetical protein